MSGYELIEGATAEIKAWTRGVPVGDEARRQLRNIANLPIIFRHVAAMPDVHLGTGATVGSVVATRGAIIPAAVGVDIGCGMMAVRTNVSAAHLPDNLAPLRRAIEAAVPHGGVGLKGGWRKQVPSRVESHFRSSGLADGLIRLERKHRAIRGANSLTHLGTLGGGNHFIELCLDEDEQLWVMLHSGSRGVGNRVGRYFIEQARRRLDEVAPGPGLADRDLAYFDEGEPLFDDYVEAVSWAQDFAAENRVLMMRAVLDALQKQLPRFKALKQAVNCHHNYVARERHFDTEVWVTRKGAVRAGRDDLGIIPGSMGARSFIVRGKGEAESFRSCSHGAGRVMSRGEARRTFTLADHRAATDGVECRKDRDVIDETPGAYKNIDAVIAAQADLVEVVHTLKQIVCIKG